MKPALVIGVLLIVLGIAALVIKTIPYKTQEDVINLGPIHATAEREKVATLPPALGITLIAGGVVLVAVGSRGGARR